MLAFGSPPAERARATVVFSGRPAAVIQASFIAKVVSTCGASPMTCQ